jgi:hypothetical protein
MINNDPDSIIEEGTVEKRWTNIKEKMKHTAKNFKKIERKREKKQWFCTKCRRNWRGETN